MSNTTRHTATSLQKFYLEEGNRSKASICKSFGAIASWLGFHSFQSVKIIPTRKGATASYRGKLSFKLFQQGKDEFTRWGGYHDSRRVSLRACLILALFANLRTARFIRAPRQPWAYILARKLGASAAFVPLWPGHYRKRYSRFLRAVVVYMQRDGETYTVVPPINIDQAQQWLAGKRIDILYFPPATYRLPARPPLCYSNCNTRNKLQDTPFSLRFFAEILMDANGIGEMFNKSLRSKESPRETVI